MTSFKDDTHSVRMCSSCFMTVPIRNESDLCDNCSFHLNHLDSLFVIARCPDCTTPVFVVEGIVNKCGFCGCEFNLNDAFDWNIEGF